MEGENRKKLYNHCTNTVCSKNNLTISLHGEGKIQDESEHKSLKNITENNTLHEHLHKKKKCSSYFCEGISTI